MQDYTLAIAHALGWPLAFVIAVIVLYKPLARLIDRIKRAKTPWGEFDAGN